MRCLSPGSFLINTGFGFEAIPPTTPRPRPLLFPPPPTLSRSRSSEGYVCFRILLPEGLHHRHPSPSSALASLKKKKTKLHLICLLSWDLLRPSELGPAAGSIRKKSLLPARGGAGLPHTRAIKMAAVIAKKKQQRDFKNAIASQEDGANLGQDKFKRVASTRRCEQVMSIKFTYDSCIILCCGVLRLQAQSTLFLYPPPRRMPALSVDTNVDEVLEEATTNASAEAPSTVRQRKRETGEAGRDVPLTHTRARTQPLSRTYSLPLPFGQSFLLHLPHTLYVRMQNPPPSPPLPPPLALFIFYRQG